MKPQQWILGILLCMVIGVSSCSPNTTMVSKPTIANTIQFQTVPTPITTSTPNLIFIPTETLELTKTPGFANVCPKIAPQIQYEGNILLYDKKSQELIRLDVNGKKQVKKLFEENDNTGLPNISPDGKWLFWTEKPLFIQEQGIFKSMPGRKRLVIFNLSNEMKQVISLPEIWMTAMEDGWTNDNKIKILIFKHQSDITGNLDEKEIAVIDPKNGSTIAILNQKFNFDDLYYSSQPMEGFAEYSPDNSNVLYTNLDDTVRLLDKDKKEIWKSQKYSYIFPSQEENVWDSIGKNAVYISSTLEGKQQYYVNILDLEKLNINSIKIPSISPGNRQTILTWSWIQSSKYLNVIFKNQDISIKNSTYPAGVSFIIDSINFSIKPLCIENQHFYSGVFINQSNPYILFTTLKESGDATIWMLDIQKWEAMSIYNYQIGNNQVYLLGGSNNQ